MLDALYIAATGMQAQQTHVDAIANNLTNMNTQGYKKGRVNFTELMTRETQRLAPNALDADAGLLGAAQRLGAGVGIASLIKLFDLGDFKKTESAFDISIAGDGFIEVAMPDGSRAYTRGGTLRINVDGQLSTQAGHALKPGLSIPENAQNLVISADGRVQVNIAGQSMPLEVGRLDLVRFANPAALAALGDNLYRAVDASGEPMAGRAGEDGIGEIRQGFLEASNVKLVEEMVNLVVAQRAYEANVKVVQASDEMLGLVNTMRK